MSPHEAADTQAHLQGEVSRARLLKHPSLVLLIITIISAALWWTSDRYKVERISALQQTRADLDRARDEYRRTVEAEGIVRTSSQRYRQLQQRGFVGDEPRLIWIESLRATGREHHLYNLQYSLHQRQAVQLSGMENTEHYQLYASSMQLQLDLAHEVDLLRYFTDLERRRPAIYQLRSCTLKSLTTDTDLSLDKANIKASCDLIWYTANNLVSINYEEEPM